MTKYALATLTLFSLAAPLFAKDYLNCTDGDGKTIRLAVENQKFIYEYGSEDAPELRLVGDEHDVEVQPWPGAGNTIWNGVDFRNQGYIYGVFTSFDRSNVSEDDFDEEDATRMGVVVFREEPFETISTKLCQSFTVMPEIDFVHDMMQEEFGKCYDMSSGDWIDCE